jgi:hypothetical protein
MIVTIWTLNILGCIDFFFGLFSSQYNLSGFPEDTPIHILQEFGIVSASSLFPLYFVTQIPCSAMTEAGVPDQQTKICGRGWLSALGKACLL